MRTGFIEASGDAASQALARRKIKFIALGQASATVVQVAAPSFSSHLANRCWPWQAGIQAISPTL